MGTQQMPAPAPDAASTRSIGDFRSIGEFTAVLPVVAVPR